MDIGYPCEKGPPGGLVARISDIITEKPAGGFGGLLAYFVFCPYPHVTS